MDRTRREARAGARIAVWPEASLLVLEQDPLRDLQAMLPQRSGTRLQQLGRPAGLGEEAKQTGLVDGPEGRHQGPERGRRKRNACAGEHEARGHEQAVRLPVRPGQSFHRSSTGSHVRLKQYVWMW